MNTRTGFVLLDGISADSDNRSREANNARSGAGTPMRIADPEKAGGNHSIGSRPECMFK
jgi:hypothetical protein